MQGQDWETTVIRKKRPTASQQQSSGAVNAALRSGAGVDTLKKFDASKNAKDTLGQRAAKLDRETDELKHDTVSSELKKQIMSARLAKKLTQAQLANTINEKPQIIQEYESGKAIPDAKVLGKLSRALGVTLKKNPVKK
jgi:putative transcription factor